MRARVPSATDRRLAWVWAIRAAILAILCSGALFHPVFLRAQTQFSLSADVNGATGDQGITSLNTSPGRRVSIQLFGQNVRDSRGVSVRFEYDPGQVVYEDSENGDVLPNAQILEESGTNPTFVKVSLASLAGRATASTGLMGTVHFRTTAGFSGTTIRITLSELGRGTAGTVERLTLNIRIELRSGPPCPDFDGDGRVGFPDFLMFAAKFGTSQGDGQYEAPFDLDSNGSVGFSDFLIFAAAFGKGCDTTPPPPEGLAPAGQAAFNSLAVGKRILTESLFMDFVSAGRFAESLRRHEGTYTYTNTGANTGQLTQIYDNSELYGGRCTTQLTFTSVTTGTSRYTCDNGETGEVENWRLAALSTPLFVAAAPDTLRFAFWDTWRAGETRAYDIEIRKKTPQGSWNEVCFTFTNDSGNTQTSYVAPPLISTRFESGTTYEMRYRYRNSSSCDTGTPGPWSPIAEGRTYGSGNGGGGGGGGGASPDLVVETPSVSNSSPGAGASFTLRATVRNRGSGPSAPTTLRYYRSTNATITSNDTEVGTDAVGRLSAGGTSQETISLTAPSSSGTYYYGACVESVSGESETGNNCSAAVSITVGAAPPPPAPSASMLYWTDWGTDKIQRADLDGSNVEDLVSGAGLSGPDGLALDMAGGKMYWTDAGTSKIQRADLDGSNVEDLITSGLSVPYGLAVDVSGGKMYWTNRQNGKIQRADLDGSDVEDLLTLAGLAFPGEIALDVSGGKMYWTNPGSDKIQRANLDGSALEDLITSGLSSPTGLALDVSGGKMYWTDRGTRKIQRASLSGTNVEDLVTGLTSPNGLDLDVSGGKMYWTDVDADKVQRANLDGSNVEDLLTGADGLVDPSGLAVGVRVGGDEVDNGVDPITITNARCNHRPLSSGSNLHSVTIQGTITANRTLVSGTITGYADGQLLSVYNLGAMTPGQTTDFTITGTISTTASTIRCRISWDVRFRGAGIHSGFNEL